MEAGSYVYDLLVQHAAQPFSDKAQENSTKMFMEDFSKKYMFK
jgi:hypothetical protein